MKKPSSLIYLFIIIVTFLYTDLIVKKDNSTDIDKIRLKDIQEVNFELDSEDYLKVYDYYGHDWLNKVDKALNKVNNDEVVDYLKDDYDTYNLYNLNFTKEKVYFQD